MPRLLCLLAACLLLGLSSGARADDDAEARAFDRVRLRNGRTFEGRITSEDGRCVVMELASKSGGRGCIRFPREMVSQVERGLERAPPRAPGCVRDQWYLLRSGTHVLGVRRLVLKRIRTEGVDGWRLAETVEHFPRGPQVPAVTTQRTERTDLAFRVAQMHYREVGDASANREGPRRYERILTGTLKDEVWQALVHEGGRAEQRNFPVPPHARGRLGQREHVLRQRELGLNEISFIEASTGRIVKARAGYVALDARDGTGRPYDEFVWEEDGARMVSRYRSCEVVEEAVREDVVAVPATKSQVDAARGDGSDVSAERGVVRVAEIGLAFRVPNASWRYARVRSPASALGWRQIGALENRALVADVRVEWDPEGAVMAPGEGEAAARLLERLRAWCPDLRVVRPRQRLAFARTDGQPAWRMDFTGTLKGEQVRTVAVVVDQGQGRALLLAACPEVSWPQAAQSIERFVASIERL